MNKVGMLEMMSYLGLAVCMCTIYCIVKWINIKRYQWTTSDGGTKLKLPPGTMGLPIIGETLQFIRLGKYGKFFDDRTAKYGKIYKTHLFGKPTIRICDIEYVRLILTNEHRLVVGTWPPSFRKLMGPGSLVMSGPDEHRFNKRMLLETFKKDNISAFFPVIQTHIVSKIQTWDSENKEIDIYESVKDVAFSSTCKILFGVNPSSLEMTELSTHFHEFSKGIFTIPVNIPGTTFYKANVAKRTIQKLIKNLLNTDTKNNESAHCKDNTGLLQIYMNKCKEKGKAISTEEILNVSLELLFGGQETSTSILSQFLISMKQHPEVLRKLRNELHSVLQSNRCHDSEVKQSQLCQLVYMKAVVKELLRLFPPIGGGFRDVLKTFTLGEYVIPEGWVITYALPETHVMNNNSDVTDITQFRPERWIDRTNDKKGDTNKPPYLPFGMGGRACVGKEYALQFIEVFITAIVSHFDWNIVNNVEDIEFIIVPVRRPAQTVFSTFKMHNLLTQKL